MIWRDLLGIPFKLHGRGKDGMDCGSVMEEIQKRLGRTPPPTNPFRTWASAAEFTGAEMGSYFDRMGKAYELLGVDTRKATQEGDLILARNEDGLAVHLFTLVDVPTGTFLTAEHFGGVRASRRMNIKNPVAVYRLKETEQ